MSFQFEFEQEGKGLDRAKTILRGATNAALREIGKTYAPVLKAETPRRSGKLANSTRGQITGSPAAQELQVRQGARTPNGAFYGGFVRKGTAAHEIRPVRAKALRFVIGGNVVFAKKVNHPGTKPNPYHERALTKVSGQIDGIISRTGIKVAADLMG